MQDCSGSHIRRVVGTPDMMVPMILKVVIGAGLHRGRSSCTCHFGCVRFGFIT